MISSYLTGGLGNQMFQIAAAYSLALENSDEAVFDLSSCKTFMQGNPASKYKQNIFKKIKDQDNLSFDYIHEEKNHAFNKIPYGKNLLLKGYFQSEKYFINNKKKNKRTFQF